MNTEQTLTNKAIEAAMARIGCPPGDNADADLYKLLQSALVEQQGKEQGPLLLDSSVVISHPPTYLSPEKSVGKVLEVVAAVFRDTKTDLRMYGQVGKKGWAKELTARLSALVAPPAQEQTDKA